MTSVEWHIGDAIKVLSTMDADSVDIVLTSPPYFSLRSYTDGGEHYDGQIGSEATPAEFLAALWAVTAECKRVLKPSGSMFVNLGDKYVADNRGSGGDAKRGEAKHAPAGPLGFPTGGMRQKSLMGLPWRYAIGCIDDLNLILRAEVVWSKPNGLPESVTDRVRRSHEQWFHFTKSPRYYSAVDEVREPHAPKTLTHRGGDKAHGNERNPDNNFGSDKPRVVGPLGKLPGSVWTIPSEPLKVPDWLGIDHFAAFPQEWPRRLILGWSPPGICVECGEGRRPVVAKDLHVSERPGKVTSLSISHGPDGREGARSSTEATITGYACACPTPDAPTRPAVVLDPFGGTGTVPRVAALLDRHGIGIDLSGDYARLAKWRCKVRYVDTVEHGRVELASAGKQIVAKSARTGKKVMGSSSLPRLLKRLDAGMFKYINWTEIDHR